MAALGAFTEYYFDPRTTLNLQDKVGTLFRGVAKSMFARVAHSAHLSTFGTFIDLSQYRLADIGHFTMNYLAVMGTKELPSLIKGAFNSAVALLALAVTGVDNYLITPLCSSVGSKTYQHNPTHTSGLLARALPTSLTARGESWRRVTVIEESTSSSRAL